MSTRWTVPIDEAIARIGDGAHIHTFFNPLAKLLLGCDHERDEIIAAIREFGVEEAGPEAAKMQHTLVIVNYRGHGALFIEAAPRSEGT